MRFNNTDNILVQIFRYNGAVGIGQLLHLARRGVELARLYNLVAPVFIAGAPVFINIKRGCRSARNCWFHNASGELYNDRVEEIFYIVEAAVVIQIVREIALFGIAVILAVDHLVIVKTPYDIFDFVSGIIRRLEIVAYFRISAAGERDLYKIRAEKLLSLARLKIFCHWCSGDNRIIVEVLDYSVILIALVDKRIRQKLQRSMIMEHRVYCEYRQNKYKHRRHCGCQYSDYPFNGSIFSFSCLHVATPLYLLLISRF